jgi:two-component system phosphate regulon sensor histidine kinase PhoR
MGLIINPFSKIKELQEKLQKRQIEFDLILQKYEAMLEGITEGVIAFDLSGEITLVNPAAGQIFGLSKEEMLGKIPIKVVLCQQLMNLVKEVIVSQQTAKAEFKVIFPREKNIAAYAGPIKSHDGESYGVIVILHDITELQKLEMYRSEFVANVSHELKTPLTSIRNYVETLLAGAINDKEHNLDFLNKIEKHTLNLSGLIDDILEISRLESRREIRVFVSINLIQVINRALETVSEKAKKRNIVLKKQCEAAELTIQGMEDHIYRAILNLLDNAINYTDASGKVIISCEKDDKEIKVSISDTGMGIPKEHLNRIFERFYRLDKARSRELGGTGLGLAIVNHVMEVHNGKVMVESEVGKGSKFTLIFPVSS